MAQPDNGCSSGEEEVMSARETLKRKEIDRNKPLLEGPELEDAFSFDKSPLPRRSGSRIGSGPSGICNSRPLGRRPTGDLVCFVVCTQLACARTYLRTQTCV